LVKRPQHDRIVGILDDHLSAVSEAVLPTQLGWQADPAVRHDSRLHGASPTCAMLVSLPHLHGLASEKRANAASLRRRCPTLVVIRLGRHELFGLDKVDDAGSREMAG